MDMKAHMKVHKGLRVPRNLYRLTCVCPLMRAHVYALICVLTCVCVCPHLCLRFRVVQDATRAPVLLLRFLVSLLTCCFLHAKKKRQGDGSPPILPIQRRGYRLVLKQWRTLHCVPASNAMTPLVPLAAVGLFPCWFFA